MAKHLEKKNYMCISQQEKPGSNLKHFTLIKINSLVPARKTFLYLSQLLHKAKASTGVSLRTEDASLIFFLLISSELININCSHFYLSVLEIFALKWPKTLYYTFLQVFVHKRTRCTMAGAYRFWSSALEAVESRSSLAVWNGKAACQQDPVMT